jgi:hypothetical protein
MPISTVNTDAWTSVVTTTQETVFQNQNGICPMYITTEDTAGLPFNEGFHLPPNAAVVIGPGQSVKAVTFRNAGPIFYMVVS